MQDNIKEIEHLKFRTKEKPTAKEFKDNYSKSEWHWNSSGVHAYNVLLCEELKAKGKIKKKQNGSKH